MPHIVPSKEVGTRNDFGTFCNVHRVRIAVEVGTDLGKFAKEFMLKFAGPQLVCIDAYEPYEEADWPRLTDMLQTVLILEPWIVQGRIRIIQHKSPAIIPKLPWWMINEIDFVYIDGSHLYESVMADIQGWWDVLRPGNILAGHDYDESHPGVMEAVQRFFQSPAHTVFLTSNETLKSWYVIKP